MLPPIQQHRHLSVPHGDSGKRGKVDSCNCKKIHSFNETCCIKTERARAVVATDTADDVVAASVSELTDASVAFLTHLIEDQMGNLPKPVYTECKRHVELIHAVEVYFHFFSCCLIGCEIGIS